MKETQRILNDERGMSFAEYLIILVVVAVAGIGMWTTFGDTIQNKLQDQATELETM